MLKIDFIKQEEEKSGHLWRISEANAGASRVCFKNKIIQ